MKRWCLPIHFKGLPQLSWPRHHYSVHFTSLSPPLSGSLSLTILQCEVDFKAQALVSYICKIVQISVILLLTLYAIIFYYIVNTSNVKSFGWGGLYFCLNLLVALIRFSGFGRLKSWSSIWTSIFSSTMLLADL